MYIEKRTLFVNATLLSIAINIERYINKFKLVILNSIVLLNIFFIIQNRFWRSFLYISNPIKYTNAKQYKIISEFINP